MSTCSKGIMGIVKNHLILVALGILLAGFAVMLGWMWLIGAIIVLMPVVVISLVWRILSDPIEAVGNFEHRFYQDWTYERNVYVNDKDEDQQ